MSTELDAGTVARRTGRARKGLWIAIIVVIGWLAIGGISGPVFSKISTVQENDNSAFLPESAESTIANKIIVKFSDQSADLLPTLLLLVGDVTPRAILKHLPSSIPMPAHLAAKSCPNRISHLASTSSLAHRYRQFHLKMEKPR